MMERPEEFRLQTNRLELRPLERRDLVTLCGYRSDANVARHQSWETPYSMEQGQELLRTMRATAPGQRGAWYQLAIERREDGVLLGDIGFRILPEDTAQAEIGFTLSLRHQKQGYATEAARLVLSHLFEEYGLHRVRANCTGENGASARLLGRLGMRREGHCVQSAWFKGEWVDELWFAILYKEWQQVRLAQPLERFL